MSQPGNQQWSQPHYNPYGQQPPGPPAPPPPGMGFPPPPQPAPKKRKKWPWIVGGVVVLLVIIGVSGGNGGSSPTGQQLTTAAAGAPAAPAVKSQPATQAPAAPAAPAEPQYSPPTDYTGKGDDVVTIKKDDGPAIVSFECAKCSGNTVLQTDGADPLLVNTIGSYKGRHMIDYRNGSTTSTLTVKATGSWKITVASGPMTATKGDTSVSGHGDDVALLTSSNISKAAITNNGGQSNFVVWVIGSTNVDLAVNTIGGYTGTVPLDGPAFVTITSTGDWSITGS